MADELRAKDCYAGQRVFWVMWCDPCDTAENRSGWYWYKTGLSPEVWSATVDRISRNGAIFLSHYGRSKRIYACEIDAIRAAYDYFCSSHLSYSRFGERCPVGEASRVMRDLAELEFGINAWASSARSLKDLEMEAADGR